MNRIKRFERFAKFRLRSLLKHIIKPAAVSVDDIDRKSVSKVLLVRQDSRLGNLVLMMPLVVAVKNVFPDARLDVLVSEGFDGFLGLVPQIDKVVVFRKTMSRKAPWRFIGFVRGLRKERYDLAVDVSDGAHFSFNNILLTSLSGAKYRLGYDREDAGVFLNILAPKPPENIHMTHALFGLLRYIYPEIQAPSLFFPVTDVDRMFAADWLRTNGIADHESFFVIHPGGRGKKQWGVVNFVRLIDRILEKIGVKIVVIVGKEEMELIGDISARTIVPIHVLENVTVGRMAAVIERCSVFISNDTGPMHVASALGRPTIGIFITSDSTKYGPRGVTGRSVQRIGGKPTVEDVMSAIDDVLGNNVC